jgi:hypothetical protein
LRAHRSIQRGRAAWLSGRQRLNLEDHYGDRHRELRARSIEAFDASAQESIILGIRFTYLDRTTRLRRIGYFHRETSRFVAVDLGGYIVSHFQTDEGYCADLPFSTYQD